MNLTPEQQEALGHARDVLGEAPSTADTALLAEWYRMTRNALIAVVSAFEDDGGAP